MCNLRYNNQLKKSELFFCFGLFFYLFLLILLFNISFNYLLKFLLLNVVSVILPGIAILSYTKLRMTRIGVFLLSYLFGYAFLVVEYFFSRLAQGFFSFSLVNYVVLILSSAIIIFKLKKNTFLELKDNSNESITIFFFLTFLFFNVFAYAANYLSPDIVEIFNCHRDIQYWVNNTVSLKIAWPADYLFMKGVPLNYHYFSNIPIAFLCDVYNIDVFSMSFPLYALTKTIVIVGPVSFLLNLLTRNSIFVILGFILLTFSTGLENISVVTFVHHTLLAPFGFDIGYGFGILFVGLLFVIWKYNKFNIRIFFPLLIAWAMCVGSKAPVSSILLLFVAFLCFFMLINKEWIKALVYGTAVLCIFLIVCKYCVGMFTVIEGDSVSWHLSFYELGHLKYMGLDIPTKDPIANLLVYLGKQHKLFGLIFRSFFLNPLLIICVFTTTCLIYRFIRNRTVSFKKVYFLFSLLLSSIFGIGLWLMVNAGGSSEMYFAMAAVIPMSTFVVFIFNFYFVKTNKLSFSILDNNHKSFALVILLVMVVGVARYSFSAYDNQGAFKNSIKGIVNLYKAHFSNNLPSTNFDSVVYREDVEALSWIRKNSPIDSIIMTDKAILLGNNAFYLYGIFSERQQYLEGTNMLSNNTKNQKEIARRKAIIEAVYKNEQGSLEKAKKEGINYIVQTLKITPNFIYDKQKLELVNESQTIRVFKVK